MSDFCTPRLLVAVAALASVLATGCCSGGMLVRPGVLYEPDQGDHACDGAFYGQGTAGKTKFEQSVDKSREFRSCLQQSGYLAVKEDMLLGTSAE